MDYYIIFFSISSSVLLSFFYFLKKIKEKERGFLNRIEYYIEELSAAKCTINLDKERLLALEEELASLIDKNESFIQENHRLEKENALFEEKLKQMHDRMEDWQRSKDEAVQHAKSAVFEVGSQLSNRLLEEHRREVEESKKNSQETMKDATNQLYEKFQNLHNHVSGLTAKVQESSESTDMVRRALLSPVSSCNLAEITLENILKSSGLIEHCDFIMQYYIAENRLRPDALVFLPGDNVIIIDSKSSKFFFELVTSEDDSISEKLKLSMRSHLKDLSSKDYKEAIRKHLIKTKGRVNNISTMMFLPSETAVEKLQMIDREFMQKAWDNEIFPAGPIGLVNILTQAKFQIAREKQAANQDLILEEVRSLIISLHKIYEHLYKVGSGIQSIASNYDKLAAVFNRGTLNKVKSLEKLGISTKFQPSSLNRYQLIANREETISDN